MRRAVLGSSRPPRAPRKSAAPLRSFASTGRPASSQRSRARIAGKPTGTTRSLRALAEDPDRAPLPVDSPGVKLAQLTDPDRRRVQQFKNGGVAHRQRRRGPLAVGRLALHAVLAVREHQVHLLPVQHLRQHPPRLGGTELRPRVGREPAPPARVRGEGTGRRTPAGQRGTRGTSLMLTRQPAPQRRQAERARVPHAAPPRVLKKRLDVPLVSADGMTRQGTLRREVPAELSQRRAQRRGQAFGRATPGRRARGMRAGRPFLGLQPWAKCVPGQAAWERPPQCFAAPAAVASPYPTAYPAASWSGAAQAPAVVAPLDEPAGRELAKEGRRRRRGQARPLRHPDRSHAAAARHRVEDPGGLQVKQVAGNSERRLTRSGHRTAVPGSAAWAHRAPARRPATGAR